ncbi:Ger(x)C family spore germination protein [Fontibacillus sp. BL9]|uniref:Ger(x)C family spore germination protein n=1 Tax=Fontibacillus sp. BL9 TaxID=3389971 RepID=UPI00397E55EB
MKIWPVLLSIALLLTGCWDVKEVQSVNFVTALGVDYAKDHYVIYAQMLDFAEISKQESPSSTGEAKIWIGKAEGKTMAEAFNNLYPASQQRTLWTHVKAIVFSKSLLEGHLPETIASLLRSRDLRYTPWVFGTEQEIDKLMSSVSLLNHSVINSELMDPMEVYRQYSAIEPVQLIKLVNGVNEPAARVLLPSVTSTDAVWKDKLEPISLVKLNGAYLISGGRNRGFVDTASMGGIKYASFKKMFKFPLTLSMPDGSLVVVNVVDSKSKTNFKIKSGVPSAHMKVKARIHVVEVAPTSEASAKKIKELATAAIEKEILNTFSAAKRKNLDVFGLEKKLYRSHNSNWKQLRGGSQEPLISKLDLDELEVNLKVVHSTSYKLPKE